jgi:hypothetical protein
MANRRRNYWIDPVRSSCGEIAHALHYDGKTVLGPWVKVASGETLESAQVPGRYRRAG